MIDIFNDPSGELLAKSDLEPWLDKALLSRRGGGEGMMRRRRTTRRSACLPAPRSSGWCPPRAVSRPLEAYPGSPDALQMMTVPWSAPTIRQRTPRGTLRQGPGRSRGGFTTRIGWYTGRLSAAREPTADHTIPPAGTDAAITGIRRSMAATRPFATANGFHANRSR